MKIPLPASDEGNTLASGRDPQDSFIDSPFSLFPSLPRDSYISTPTERITLEISHEDISPSITAVWDRFLQVAWALVLADHTNSTEVLFGMAYHGSCTNTGEQAIMPFRLKLQSEDTMTEALTAAASYGLHMRQFEHMGLQEFSTMSPENVVICQFRSLLVVDTTDSRNHQQSESVLSSFGQKYPLTIYCGVDDCSTHVHAAFDPTVLHPDLLRMILDQFADILRMSISNPQAQIKDLQGAGSEGLKRLLQWNRDRDETEPEMTCVDRLIEQRCGETPSATAVCAWDGTLTYGELNRWASRIAGQLAASGVRPGKFVGMFMPKSVVTIVAMLGIIKAGGAFVFLPLSLPPRRLQTICEIAQVHLILSTSELLLRASELGPTVKEIHSDRDKTETSQAHCWPTTLAEPHHPLYAIFTSGSSGEPKGVIVDRASFGPGVREFGIRTGLGPNSRLFQSVSYAFVVSVLEQLMALAAGACICVPSEEQLQSDLEGAMCSLNACWSTLTPSVARTLDPAKLPSLKSLLLAGEPVNQADIEKWKDHVTLYTLYGQSESASTLLVGQLSGSTSESCRLGHSTTGTCWIVDPEDYTRLRPIGVEGELMIESSALARAYINNVKETARTFVERPRWLQTIPPSGDRSQCLLTGDIVRYQDLHGSIQLVGRKETQTKIRGQRVELGEIECQLRTKFPSAHHVITDVISPAGSNGEHLILVAFVYSPGGLETEDGGVLSSPTAEHRLQARRAISDLRDVLPSYMIPSAILPLRFLPRTATGKIHRKTLRDMVSKLTLSEILLYNGDRASYRAPNTPEERLLQSICEELLGLPASSASLNDNFFQVGGDSLTARQLVSMARFRGLAFTVPEVFEAATLGSLAGCARKHNETIDGKSAVLEIDPFDTLNKDFLHELPPSLAAEDVEDVHPTNEMQTMLVDAQVVDYFPFKITGPLDTHQLRRACEALIQSHAVLRSVFVPFHGRLLQVVLRHKKTPYIELTPPSGEDPNVWAQSYCTEDKKKAPPMSQPIIRFVLIRQNPQQHVFVIRLAHAQYDGGCLQTIATQISAAYNNQPLRVMSNFSDYIRHCARLRTPEALGFWRDLITGAEVTRLPRRSAGEDFCVIYPGECSPVSPPPGITMATAIKAAWSYVLRRETGKTDVLFGQVGNCRGIDLPGARDIIGMCLNTTPVRVTYTDLETVHDLFRAVQQQHVRALEFETIDWKDMVAHSTSWPKDTDLDSVVLHENFDGISGLHLGSATGQMGNPVFTTPGWRRHMLVTWPGPGKLTTFLMVRNQALDKEYAEGLLSDFNKTLTKFLDFPEASLASL
jgi:amino acid adenylation domain-containing protein